MTKLLKISLQVNIDGLPIYKSSNSQYWPILGLVENYNDGVQTNKLPFVIGVFFGEKKTHQVLISYKTLLRKCSILKKKVSFLKTEILGSRSLPLFVTHLQGPSSEIQRVTMGTMDVTNAVKIEFTTITV